MLINRTLAVCKEIVQKIEQDADYCSVEIYEQNRMGLPEILSLASSTTSIAAMVTAILNNTK